MSTSKSPSLGSSTAAAWPKEWRDNSDDEDASVKAVLASMRKEEALFDSLGLPCARVTKDGAGIQPHCSVGLAAANDKGLDDDFNTEHISLIRDLPEDQKPAAARGKSREREVAIVPKTKVDSLRSEGWQLWQPPEFPYDKKNPRRDTRKVDRPVDIITEGRPAEDIARYSERGLTLITSTMPNNSWKPDQLMGQNGSDPNTIARSLSFSSFESKNDRSEKRSATSTGHVVIHRREVSIGVGWGDYDENTRWQSFGRKIPKDAVEDKKWATSFGTCNFVSDSGEVKPDVPVFKQEDLPTREPVSLYDRLHHNDGRKQRQPRQEKMPQPAWPGVSKNGNE